MDTFNMKYTTLLQQFLSMKKVSATGDGDTSNEIPNFERRQMRNEDKFDPTTLITSVKG